jgi:cystathionine beta-lyase/cystathionine gamma-synthase
MFAHDVPKYDAMASDASERPSDRVAFPERGFVVDHATDPLRHYVADLPARLRDVTTRVAEPIAPTTSTTHGAKTLAEFAALKDREASGTLRPDEAEYFRYGTPITRRLESRLARLEGGEAAVVFRSGMAAISAVIDSVLPLSGETGHVIVGTEGYRQTRNILDKMVKRRQVELTVIPMDEFNEVYKHLKPNTVAVFYESISNPYLRVIDVQDVKAQIVAAGSKALNIVDHTFASPINQRPLELGADLVVPSLTKYISGNNQVGAGAVIGRAGLVASVKEVRGQVGNIAHDSDCLGVEVGLETLAERVERANRNGMHVAELLARNPNVLEVWYPGHPSHRDYTTAQTQMSGFGGVISFRIRARDFHDIAAFTDEFIAASPPGTYIAPSFGGEQPLLSVVTIVSHFSQTPEERKARGIPNDLLRLSVGTGSTQSLTDAFQRGFSALEARMGCV